MEFTTKNGVKVKINPADFEDAMDLQSAIMEKISNSKFELKMNFDEEDFDVADIVRVAMSVASSKEIRETLFKCLARCTYDGQKITKNTFEDVGSRKDFYEVSFACLKENIGLFIEPLISLLSPMLSKLGQGIKSLK